MLFHISDVFYDTIILKGLQTQHSNIFYTLKLHLRKQVELKQVNGKGKAVEWFFFLF